MSRRLDRHAPVAWLLHGWVHHARLRPTAHAFTYPLFQICCDLDHLDELSHWWFGVDRRRLLSLSRQDYGPRDGQALAPWMRTQLTQAGIPADGPIWLQTIPRIAGFAFNPVSFWYCYDHAHALRALYADVRNTFGAHHGHLLCADDRGPIDDDTVLVCRKAFHVSPFCDVAGDYAFRVRQQGDQLRVAIDYHDEAGLLLRTALSMRAVPFDGVRVARALLRQPLNAINVVVRIHWQALRLWLKRVPFHGATPPALHQPDPSTQRPEHPPARRRGPFEPRG